MLVGWNIDSPTIKETDCIIDINLAWPRDGDLATRHLEPTRLIQGARV